MVFIEIANTYIGVLKIGGKLEINVDVGSHILFFKSKLKPRKSSDTSFEVVVNEPDEIVEIKSEFDIANGKFTIKYADNAPHIPVYRNSNDVESKSKTEAIAAHQSKNKIYCKKCGMEIVGDAKFCNKCGQALNQPRMQVETSANTQKLKYRNLITCRSCGAMVAKTAKSCPECGAKTPGQLAGETVAGIGCGLLSVPVIIFLIVVYVVLWNILK